MKILRHYLKPAQALLLERPLSSLALAIVLAACASYLLGVQSRALSAAVLMAPGLALINLLPERCLTRPLAALAAIPALGIALTMVTTVSLSSLFGVKLLAPNILTLQLVTVLVLLALPLGKERLYLAFNRKKATVALTLLGILALAVLLDRRVIGGTPIPGNDWAHYLLYAQEIARKGSLLIDNNYWMLGSPFREDPGMPALYGSFLVLSNSTASTLVHGIGLLSLIGILSIFSYVATAWGYGAGLVAAAVYATLPINLNILGWHGLANVAALALMPLILMFATELISSRLKWRTCLLFAVLLTALAATHRLSFVITVIVLIVTTAIAALFGNRRQTLINCIKVSVFIPLVAVGVAYDLWQRNKGSGGTQSYLSYISTKIELSQVQRSLTTAALTVAVIGLIYLAVKLVRQHDRKGLPLLATAMTLALLSYAWIFHIPLFYFRMAYYLPLVVAPAAAVAITRLRRPALSTGAACLLVAWITVLAVGQANRTREFYQFLDPASLRGLKTVKRDLTKSDVVVTDRCWSFLSTYLLQHKTLAAIDPEDIQPAAEVPLARQARSILKGGSRGRSLAEHKKVRFILADPQCTDGVGRPIKPPHVGRPIYASERLVVFKLSRPS